MVDFNSLSTGFYPGKNRYGVDVAYFTKELNKLVRDLGNHTPEELARALVRLSNAAT